MKKLIWFILLLIIAGGLKAQDSLETKRGTKGFELVLNPLQGGLNLNNSKNQAKFRHFVSNNIALRYALALNIEKKENHFTEYDDFITEEYKIIEKSYGVFFDFGFEKHFNTTKKISPYCGLEVTTGYQHMQFKDEEGAKKFEVNGILLTFDNADAIILDENGYVSTQKSEHVISLDKNKRGYSMVGANLFIGVDYYLGKGFYVGYEINYSFKQKKYHTIEANGDISGFSATDVSWLSTSKEEIRSFSAEGNLIKGIRIGYMF